MDGNKINLLKSYFTAFQLNNEFYSYADLARYLGISTAIVKNVYTDRTVFPSKKLTKHLSERFNKNPEAILADIYESCFCKPSYKYSEIVAMSLYYNFGYSIVNALMKKRTTSYLERCVMILSIVCYHFCMMKTQNIRYEMSICSMVKDI